MYLRRTSRTNKNGTVTSYLALAHNYRDVATGVSKPMILHSFGREDQLDIEGLERLMASIARYLDIDVPVAGGSAAGRWPGSGGAWVLDQLWSRLGIGTAIRRLAKSPRHRPGRKLDVELLERVIFAVAAAQLLAPYSKLQRSGHGGSGGGL